MKRGRGARPFGADQPFHLPLCQTSTETSTHLRQAARVVPIRDLAFEHRMYLPLAPLVALLVIGAAALIGRVGLAPATTRGVAIATTAAIVATLAALTRAFSVARARVS